MGNNLRLLGIGCSTRIHQVIKHNYTRKNAIIPELETRKINITTTDPSPNSKRLDNVLQRADLRVCLAVMPYISRRAPVNRRP